jgi:Oxysterol-binding protein.
MFCRPDSDRYYSFTELACQLNEPEPGVAPTDTRNRPDQRLMESGMWDEANIEKVRLEEKQRAVRRIREAEAEKAASEGTEVDTFLWMVLLCYEFVFVFNLNICFCAF